MNKRLLSLLLALLMLVSLVPTAALAAVRGGDAVPAEAPAAGEDAVTAPAPAAGEDAVTAPAPAAEDLPAAEGDSLAVLAGFAADSTAYDYSGIITASAPSYQAASGSNSPAAALDGNANTWYHSSWGGGSGDTDLSSKPEKRYIQLELAEATQLNGLRYLSRSLDYGDDYGNGVITEYDIKVSNTTDDDSAFTSVATGTWAPGASAWRVALFNGPVTVKYLRLYGVTTYGNGQGFAEDPTEKDKNKYISAAEIRLLTPVNLARLTDVTATDDNHEEGTRTNGETFNLNGAQAIDGVKSGGENNNSGHWSTDKGIDLRRTLIVDLHRLCDINEIKLFWKNASVYTYTLSTSSDNTTWNTVYTQNTRVSTDAAGESVTVSSHNTDVRYVRLQATPNAGDGNWGNVNLWEIEIYGLPGELITGDDPTPAVTASTVVTWLTPSFDQASGKFTYTVASEHEDDAALENFDVKIAANLEQVVGPDGTVYTPLCDIPVEIALTVTNKTDDTDWASSSTSTTFTVSGAHTAADNTGGNPKPAVIPEIMEWYSHGTATGYKDQSYTLPAPGGTVRILHRYTLDGVATALAADLKDMFGVESKMVHLSDEQYATLQDSGLLSDGAIVLFDVQPSSREDPRGRVRGYDEETYGMEIYDSKVYIYATHATGAYWGTRTLLQGMKLSADGRSFPNGTLRDYPEFKVRGFIMDVGRKPISMSMLREIAKNMAWYKLNDLHLHLNDNLIFMEDYTSSWTSASDFAKANNAYSAFRLESDIVPEANGRPLAAKDYHYTKAEFKTFMNDCAKLGITVVPEIDVPAHAKAIADAFPSIRLHGNTSDHPSNCHLDLSDNKYDDTLGIVQDIFDEYFEAGVFSGVVDFGSDEYLDSRYFSNFQRFTKDMIQYIKDKGATPRLWGSLGNQPGVAAQVADGVQMNIWAPGTSASYYQADPQTMFDSGFDLINVVGSTMYIVPSGNGERGGFKDYLNLTSVYNWTPNSFNSTSSSTTLPAGSKQLLGGCFALWQDNIDTRASGIDEVDTFDRFFDALPVVSVKTWGEGKELDRTLTELQADAAKIGLAPNSNPYFEVAEEDRFSYDFTSDHDLALTNATVDTDKQLLVLNGGASYAKTGLDRLGWGSRLTFNAFKLQGGGEEQVIFESDLLGENSSFAYNELAIKALPVEGDDTKWKLGFSRELYDYEFPVELPVGEWVQLILTNTQQTTMLSVNGGVPVAAVGKFVSNADSNTPFRGKTGITNSSFEFPVNRIGSKTNAFHGYIAAVSTAPSSPVPVNESDYVIKPADNAYTLTAPSELKNETSGEGPATLAGDGDASTFWHSNWSTNSDDNPNDLSNKPEKRYIQIELANPATVGSLLYLPRANAGNGTVTEYRVEVSSDGETYTEAATGTWIRATGWKTALFSAVQQNVKFVRLYGVTTYGDVTNKFMTAAEVRVCAPFDFADTNADETPKAVVEMPSTTCSLENGKAEPLPNVFFDGNILVKDRDYTLSYEGNTTVGSTATVKITGKGAYTGLLSATFSVAAAPRQIDLADATATFAQTSYPLENGKAEPVPVVKVGEKLLLRDLDYTLSYENNTRVGATATVTVTGTGSCEGVKTLTFVVAAPLVKKNLSGGSISLRQRTFPYEGIAITPDPVITFGGATLVRDEDYTVSYARNNNIGTGTVTVTGINIYEGTLSANFTIVDPATGNDLSNTDKTSVTFLPAEYEYTGQPITPKFVVTHNGRRLVKDTDYTVELSNNINGGNGVVVIRGMGNYYGPFIATFTITGGGSSSGGGSGSGSGGSGGSFGGGAVSSTSGQQADGVTVKKTTDAAGVITTQATYPGGSKVSGTIGVDGLVTAVVTVPKSAGSVTVTIPTREEPTPGQVAVILHPDGTEEIVKTALPTEDGIQITLGEDAVLQIVDNAKTFVDVPAGNWAKSAIDFVTSREIFNGTGNRTFSPDSDMSRAMVCTVLANLAGEETKGGATWYDKALTWAKSEGISDGSTPNAIITREQLAVMLYRYADSPLVTDEVPRRFRDRDNVADWAELAVTWAVQNDLLRGRSSTGGLDLAPKATATRAEVASVLQRYVALLK